MVPVSQYRSLRTKLMIYFKPLLTLRWITNFNDQVVSMIPSNNHMREILQLCHVEDNQRVWRDPLVKHDIRSPDLMLLLQL